MTRAVVSESTRIYTPADRVWAWIGDFLSIARWHPRVLTCRQSRSGTQKLRELDIGAEANLVERLERHDDAGMRYSYTIVSGPLPVKDAEGTIWVHADTAWSSTVNWEVSFTPKDVGRQAAVAAVRDHVRAGLDSLRFTLAG